MQLISVRRVGSQSIGVNDSREQRISFGGSATVVIGGELYQGEYEVVPSTAAQTLPCKDKRMAEDVRVHPVPYLERPSEKGGIGIIIGD